MGVLVALLVLSWILGRTKGLLGALVGGFVGALALIGMATTASNGDLAALQSPVELASSILPLTVLAAVLALVVPYATGVAALAWAAGALLAAIAAARNGQAIYMLPFTVHVLAAAAVVSVARWRTQATWDAPTKPNRATPSPSAPRVGHHGGSQGRYCRTAQ